MSLKLIDLDSSASFVDGDMAGLKVSSAYLPPEMIWRRPDQRCIVRAKSYGVDQEDLQEYPPLPAHPSQDLWALGCLIYLLCSGSTLFQSTLRDNISNYSDYEALSDWTDQTKEYKLDLIPNKAARNLVSLLLCKVLDHRPAATRILKHPFFTGKSVTRLVGEQACWDAFLSYRVDTDLDIAQRIYDNLTASGRKVWWDKERLIPGDNWETCFCSGLVDSAAFICIISRGGIKNPGNRLMNFENLESDSRCDNVLLEWRLALELKERGMIEGIFPVMVGDVDSNGHYSNYFKSGCNPNPPKVVVNAVELKLREHLDREGLGSPYKDEETAASILQQVLSNQGNFIEGELCAAVEDVCTKIKKMVKVIEVVMIKSQIASLVQFYVDNFWVGHLMNRGNCSHPHNLILILVNSLFLSLEFIIRA